MQSHKRLSHTNCPEHEHVAPRTAAARPPDRRSSIVNTSRDQSTETPRDLPANQPASRNDTQLQQRLPQLSRDTGTVLLLPGLRARLSGGGPCQPQSRTHTRFRNSSRP